MKYQGHEIKTIHHPVKVRKIVDALNKDETFGWKYESVPVGKNGAAVMVIDEDNHIVGFL